MRWRTHGVVSLSACWVYACTSADTREDDMAAAESSSAADSSSSSTGGAERESGGSGGDSGADSLVRYEDVAALHEFAIARTCTLNVGVCHSSKEYPDIHTVSSLEFLVHQPCNVFILAAHGTRQVPAW